jgi:hypothetical protein
MDVYLREALPADVVVARVGEQLPAGCRIAAAAALPVEGAAVTALTRWARYTVHATSTAADEAAIAGELGSRWSSGARLSPGDPSVVDDDEVPWRPPEQRLAPPPPEADPPLPAVAAVEARITELLAAETFPLSRARDGKTVDIRAGVRSLQLSDQSPPDRLALDMVLKLDASGAGRPEDVAAALGLRARSIHRLRIGLEGESPP